MSKRTKTIEVLNPYQGKVCHLTSFKTFIQWYVRWLKSGGEQLRAEWVFCDGKPMRSWRQILDLAKR